MWKASDGTPVAAPMNHKDPVSGAIMSQDESRILSWTQDGTMWLWNFQVDYDYPKEYRPLQVEVATSTEIDDLGNVTVLDAEAWRKKRAEYIRIANEHWKTCRYKDANVYALQRGYWLPPGSR